MMTVLIAGLAVGSIYVIAAHGYVLTFMASGSVNFAQGYIVMLSTFIAYLGINSLDLPVIVVVLMAAVVGAVINALVEIFCIRPIKRKGGDSHAEILTTVGAATVISGVVALVWGTDPLRVDLFQGTQPFYFAGGLTSSINLWLILIAVVITVALALFTARTQVGMVSQAVAEDRESAVLRGIAINRLSIGAFVIAGIVAGAVGPFVGAKSFALVALGPMLAVKGFIVLALGGKSSYIGALVCGLTIGLVEAYSGRYLDGSWQNIMVLLVFITVILMRPQGIFGHSTERAV